MSPEHSLASAQASGSSTSTPPHKRRREKTGRLRRKRKHWKYFSRWNSEEIDDEHDLELYRWCKSKGLTTRSLPSATEATSSVSSITKRTRSHSNHVFSKPSSYRATLNATVKHDDCCSEDSFRTIDLISEKVFLTQLCTSISDKKSFVEHSKEQHKIEKPTEKTYKTPSPVTSTVTVHERITGDTTPTKESSLRPVIHIPTASNEEVENIEKTKDKENGIKPNDTNTTLQQKNHTTKKQSLVKSTSSPIIPKKKWSANIEADLLRLYESAADIPENSSLVSSWTKPGVQTMNSLSSPRSLTSDISLSIDKKLERTENTPNYVQALAKMFKCRLQMRKEREQAETERTLSRAYRPRIATQDAARDHFNTTGSPTYLRYRHIECNLPQNESSSGNTSTELIRSESIELRDSRYNKEIQMLPADGVNEFASFYPKRTKQKLEKLVIDQDLEGIRTHFNSRTFPELTESNEKQFYIWDTQSLSRRQTDEESEGQHSRKGEVAFIAINARLEKETRSDRKDSQTYKLGLNSPKLQKPTPALLRRRGENSQVPLSHIQTLSRKAKQCLQSNVRTRRETTDKIFLPKKHVVTDTATGNNLLFDNEYVRRTVQARWPASIGSLYIRPPTKIHGKPSAQNA